jgi:cell division protein FtsL
MTDQIKDKLQTLFAPIAIAVLGFFLVQTYMDIKAIREKVDTFNAAIILNNSRIEHTNSRINDLQKDVEELNTYTKDNDAWIRGWLEQYQGAVEWAKKNAPE